MVFYNLIIQAVVRIEKGPIGGSYLQGQRASLSCQVHGADVFLEPTEFQTQNFNPNEASITWFKNGKMIPTKNYNFGQKMSISVSKRISTLTISDLDGADAGYYQCVTSLCQSATKIGNFTIRQFSNRQKPIGKLTKM